MEEFLQNLGSNLGSVSDGDKCVCNTGFKNIYIVNGYSA